MKVLDIHPQALYDTPEVAEVLGLHPKTVYGIPERLLPRTRVGPRRGRVKIKGADLLRYLNNETSV